MVVFLREAHSVFCKARIRYLPRVHYLGARYTRTLHSVNKTELIRALGHKFHGCFCACSKPIACQSSACLRAFTIYLANTRAQEHKHTYTQQLHIGVLNDQGLINLKTLKSLEHFLAHSYLSRSRKCLGEYPSFG